jgi:hypothetical protein
MARVTEDSLIGQIRGLDPGQSFSRSKRIDLADKSRLTTAEALQKLRNLVNQAVGRLRKEEPGSNFRVESVVGITDDKRALITTVAVTRFEGEDDEEQDI